MVFRGEELRPEFVDYTQVPDRLKEELLEAGITKESMQRTEGRDRVFSEWAQKLYERLAVIIQEEWEVYKQDPLADPVLRRYMRMKERSKSEPAVVVEDLAQEVTTKEEEAEAFRRRDIEKLGLRTADAVQCVDDRVRTMLFLDTIREKLKGGERVLEAGTGTGVLAIAAVSAGAREVVAVEINPVTAIFARRVVRRCEEKKLIQHGQVKIRLEDALKYQGHPKEFDAFLDENLYTGGWHEKAVEIANTMLESVDVSQGKVIPSGLVNGVELTEMTPEVRARMRERTDCVVKDYVNPNAPKGVTPPEAYDYIDLERVQPVGVRNRLIKTVAKDGTIDTVTVFSLVQMSKRSGNFLRRNEGEFLGNDHALVLERPIQVKAGDQVEIYISYRAGDRPGQTDVRVRNMRTGEEVRNIKENIPTQIQSIAA